MTAPLTLPTKCDLAYALSLHDTLSQKPATQIDASQVESISTATLQLLCATKTAQPVMTLMDASEAMTKAIALTGLTSILQGDPA